MNIKSFHCPVCNKVLLLEEFLNHIHSCYSQDCKSKGFVSKCCCAQCVLVEIGAKSTTPEHTLEITKRPKLDVVSSSQSYFDILPSPVFQQIFSHFGQYDNFIVSLVCKRWNSLIVRDQSIDLRTIFCHFCKTGGLSVLKWLRAVAMDYYEGLLYALRAGHLEVLKWLVENGFKLSDLNIIDAAYSGNLELCKWVSRNYKFPIEKYQHVYEVVNDTLNPDVVKWLVEQDLRPDPACFSNWARTGDLAMLKWLKLNGCTWNEETCKKAAENGHFEVLKWARKLECPWNAETCAAAAEKGHFEILQWARQNNCPWTSSTTQNAAKSGNLEILKYAIENQCPVDPEIFKYAVSGGSLEMLSYLKEKKYPRLPDAYAGAAGKGNIVVLEWLLQEGFPKTRIACLEASRNGKLEALKWLREQGFPWSHDALSTASAYPQMFKWMRENSCPWSDEVILSVVRSNNFKLFKWAIKRGCPIPDRTCEEIAKVGNIEMMAFLKQLKKFTADKKVCVAAASSRKLRMLSWLVKNGAPMTKESYIAAVDGDVSEIMQWLKLNGCSTYLA